MLRLRSYRQPRVSVIIASYRWPEALRTSLTSALCQTVEELEVLVIEDGPSRASQDVVREADDPRAKWMCLRRGTGSQSGPNGLGWRRARAPIVAYLGHDDVWSPEHLASLLTVLDGAVDAAHAITLYLHAEGSQRSLIAGGTPWDPRAFVPPSSLAHWRDSPRMGSWISPDLTGMPVDYAFLMAAHARGARFAASGAPTVFKYPAAWRLDSYRTRDGEPQRKLHERLKADAESGRALFREVLAAGAPPTMMAPPPAPPGVIQDHGRRLKGLPARFGPRVTRWTPSGFLLYPGWHAAERDALGSFAWTGPDTRAIVRLDSPGNGELGVKIIVRHAVTTEQLEGLAVDVDGADLALTRAPGPGGVTVVTGWLGRGARDPTVEVGLSAAVRRPANSDPQLKDERLLGVAVSEIQLLSRVR